MSKLDDRYDYEASTQTTESTKVPNLPSRFSLPDQRIAIVGEAPGKDEVEAGEPFVGASGRFLKAFLAKAGINYNACYVGNVTQYRPPGNDIHEFDWSGPEIQEGLQTLSDEIAQYNPHLVLLLGATALRAAAGEVRSIEQWRGSIFRSAVYPFGSRKCVATFHPAACLRVYENTPIFRFDLRRARDEGKTPAIVLPERQLITPGSDKLAYADYVVHALEEIVERKLRISIDIEGYVGDMTCLSIAVSPTKSFIIPFVGGEERSFWPDLDTECRIWRALSRVLSDPAVPKILQNSLYDNFVLSYSYRAPIVNVDDDTMLKHWEAFSELEKSLAFQLSIYTKEPFYKDERKSHDQDTRWKYCCKDSAGTLEIADFLNRELSTAEAKRHYRFNMTLLRPLLYMELRGIRYDSVAAAEELAKVQAEMYELQAKLNAVTGFGLPPKGSPELFRVVREKCFYKKSDIPGPLFMDSGNALMKYKPVADRINTLLSKSEAMTDAEYGELSFITKLNFNVDAPAQVANFLYRKCGLPVQYKKEHGRRTDRETADVLAMLNLLKIGREQHTIKALLRMSNLLTQTGTLLATADPDGRIRCGYNGVGSVTGRVTTYTSPTGSGYSLQTVTQKHRRLFLADIDYDMFSIDLSGADGWTVAAWSAALGDPTMLDDYLFGLKPAKIVALMHMDRANGRKSREELRELSKQIDSGSWLYAATKATQHGTNYGMKERTVSDTILKFSYKKPPHVPIYVEPAVCLELQQLYMQRYRGVVLYQRHVMEQITTKGYLVSASGHKRVLFGRRDDHSTYQSALSNEPQENTTYVNNMAAVRLWQDPENRRDNGSVIIEPLHQVHDAILGQWPQDRREWALNKVREYFNNPIQIAGITITIPFEGKYGRSWGEADNKI